MCALSVIRMLLLMLLFINLFVVTRYQYVLLLQPLGVTVLDSSNSRLSRSDLVCSLRDLTSGASASRFLVTRPSPLDLLTLTLWSFVWLRQREFRQHLSACPLRSRSALRRRWCSRVRRFRRRHSHRLRRSTLLGQRLEHRLLSPMLAPLSVSRCRLAVCR